MAWVIFVIKPVSSTSGMNSEGRMSEPSGRIQRISASALRILPVTREIMGW